jgi:hypothetical protein
MLNACKLIADIERASTVVPCGRHVRRQLRLPFLFGIPHLLRERATGRWAYAVRELTSGLQITHGASPELHGAGGAGEPDPEAAAGRCRPVGSREHVGGPGPVVRPGQGANSTGARMPSWSSNASTRGQSPGPPDRPGRVPRPTQGFAARPTVRGGKCAPKCDRQRSLRCLRDFRTTGFPQVRAVCAY